MNDHLSLRFQKLTLAPPPCSADSSCADEAIEPTPWDLGAIVAALRRARGRDASFASSQAALALPSREALVDVIAKLRAVLFPAHFGRADLRHDGVDYFVGHTLDTTLRSLLEQVRCELRMQLPESRAQAIATTLTAEFAARLPEIRVLLESDICAALAGDPAANSRDEVVFCYPGINAITHHRIAHALAQLGAPLLARIIAELAHSQTGIDIHPGARIGGSFFIDHGTGVVIGETSVIGERVRIYQGVTLGAKSFPIDERGQIIHSLPRHPIIEDDVVIYAGATVLGRVTIGRGCTIGGNVWLTRSVPANTQITQLTANHEL
jgi:serine O-acetyltransferase